MYKMIRAEDDVYALLVKRHVKAVMGLVWNTGAPANFDKTFSEVLDMCATRAANIPPPPYAMKRDEYLKEAAILKAESKALGLHNQSYFEVH